MQKPQLQSLGRILVTTGIALACAGTLRAGFSPIPITQDSYNADVVVERTATPVLKVVTSASVDNGTNNTANTWYEVGYNTAAPSTGLPAAGSTFTAVSNANYSFQMAPSYSAPNCILIDASGVTHGTWTLTTPTAYTLLSFLGSGGNGGDVIGVTVHHQDGSVETYNPTPGVTNSAYTFGCPDWYNGTLNVAWIASGRASGTTAFGVNTVGQANPRLYFRDITLTNTASAVTSIDLSYVSGGAGSHNPIMAVSGATTPGGAVGPITVTGYDYDVVVEAGAALPGRVNATVGAGAGSPATTQSMDTIANTGNSWYERGYNINNFSGSPAPKPTDDETRTGIPAAGASLTNAALDHVYVMPADYTTNDAVYLVPSPGVSNATITLVTPTAASALSFLASAGNGPATPMVIIHHQAGDSETNNITVPDWFDNTPAFVLGANGRVAVDTAVFDVRNDSNADPKLFNSDVTLTDTLSPVTSIDIIYTNTGGRMVVFALSGSAGAVPPIITVNPSSLTTNAGVTVQLTITATANAPITYQWQKGTNGVFVNLTDGGRITGSTTATLMISGLVDPDDAADYRCVATDVAGSATSGIATVTVLSPLSVVTVPGDAIVGVPNNGNEPNEGVEKVIDDNTGKYLNFSLNSGTTVPTGFIVTPAMGRTRVTAMQLITANDAPERDPANYILEGSDDGGSTWTLISSNLVTLPDARNAGGIAVTANLTTLAMRQIEFPNSGSYTLYRWTVTKLKNQPAANSMQIGEVRLLGVSDTSGKPVISGVPATIRAFNTTNVASPQSVTLSATVVGTPTPTIQWQRNTGGSYVNLTDAGNISGAHTATLTVSPTSFSDQGNYRVYASNTSGSTTSTVAAVTILTTLPDVTQPSDTIASFGDQSNGAANDVPAEAIDDTTQVYQNGGSGLNTQAGFPPFQGPVGVVVRPSGGPSDVTAIRIYTANANPERDPVDYMIEGSNNGGATYTVISSGALALPLDRNALASLDPLAQALQEVRFANANFYTSYRLTFVNTRDNSQANSLQFGEIELLGVVKPVLTTTRNPDGTFTIDTTWPGELFSTTSLNGTPVWTDEGPISPGGVTITPNPATPAKFYRVQF